MNCFCKKIAVDSYYWSLLPKQLCNRNASIFVQRRFLENIVQKVKLIKSWFWHCFYLIIFANMQKN